MTVEEAIEKAYSKHSFDSTESMVKAICETHAEIFKIAFTEYAKQNLTKVVTITEQIEEALIRLFPKKIRPQGKYSFFYLTSAIVAAKTSHPSASNLYEDEITNQIVFFLGEEHEGMKEAVVDFLVNNNSYKKGN